MDIVSYMPRESKVKLYLFFVSDAQDNNAVLLVKRCNLKYSTLFSHIGH